MVKFQYKGLICPVFTPFSQDKKTVNYDCIEKYCNYLKTKGVQGIFVNSISGEGACLRVEERKRLAEEWLKYSRKYGFTMMLSIGGCAIADVHDLCEHAEKIGVDSVVLFPDLFYKPTTEEDLLEYFKDVAKYCPTRPIFYYHYPEYTYVKLHMVHFGKLVQKSVSNFCGFFYGHNNIEVACDLLKDGYQVIMCHNNTFTGLMALGFDTFCLITMNLYPDQVKAAYDHMKTGKLHEAYDIYNKYYASLREICGSELTESDYVDVYKRRFNKVVDFNVGDVRKPHITWAKKY